MNKETKTEAIKTLLEFSFLFAPKQKEKILENLGDFSEEQLTGLGKILAHEHKNRDKLDKQMVEDIMDSLEDYI